MLEGVLIDQAIEVLFQRARDFGRVHRSAGDPATPGARAKRCTHLRRAEFAKWKVAETAETC